MVIGYVNVVFMILMSVTCLADGPSGFHVDDAIIHHIKWDTEMHRPIARKLVSEARGSFSNLCISSVQ